MNKKIIIGIVIVLIIIIGATIIALNIDRESEEPPLIGGCAGVSLENRQECCDNWAEENDIMRIQCTGEWTIKDNKCVWECETEEENTNLQECSRNPENPIECPSGYFCYYDDKCHKMCGVGDENDCPEETPYCLQKSFCIKDSCTFINGCFAEE
jgi:hypothetical protein